MKVLFCKLFVNRPEFTQVKTLKDSTTSQASSSPKTITPTIQGTTALVIFTINQLCLSSNLYNRDENLD